MSCAAGSVRRAPGRDACHRSSLFGSCLDAALDALKPFLQGGIAQLLVSILALQRVDGLQLPVEDALLLF